MQTSDLPRSASVMSVTPSSMVIVRLKRSGPRRPPLDSGADYGGGLAGRVRALAEIGELIESGRFSLPVARTFPLAAAAEAHRVSEQGQVRGKLVLLVG